MSNPRDEQLSRRRFLQRAGRLSVALGGLAVAASLPAAISAASASGAIPASALPTPIFHGNRSTRSIAITVDDGWGPERVRRVFDILQDHNAAATFLPYTQAMRLDTALWHRIAAAGFPIANHTNSHPFMSRLSAAKQHSELTYARNVAEDISGRGVVPIFRPPYGNYDATTLRVAEDAGYPNVVLWDTTDLDTSGTKSTRVMTAAAERGTSGSILLIHGGPSLTPVVLPAIIRFYRARGFAFVTLPELLGLEVAGSS